MKTVVSNREVPHLWAHKVQPSARNSGRSLFFEGDAIFSYGHHFMIATHVTNIRGENAFLVTTADYSVTTAGHKSRVRQSIPRSAQAFHVDLSGFRDVSVDMVAEYNKRKEETLAKALRSRVNKEFRLEDVQRIHVETLQFVNFFDYDSALVTPLGFDAATLEASRLQREQIEKQQREARKAADLIKHAAEIEEWRNGGRYGYMPMSIDTMLRVVGDTVETSRGASFPLSHARKGLALVRAVVARWGRVDHQRAQLPPWTLQN